MSKIDTPLLQTSHTSTSSTISLPPEKLPELFQTMLKYPETRSHMLFLGPPGSGKTTTAQSFALALHGKKTNTFASLLFLNSSDERSLETMRQKIYPFVESRMQSLFFFDEEAPPKVIIFDEAETLTDQAQCALRPLLFRSPKDIIIIFICNSLSHIHPQILNKFLIVPFAPTKLSQLNQITQLNIPPLDSLYRRGDIRFFKQCPSDSKQITEFIESFLHASSKEQVYSIFSSPGSPSRERISWFLLFQQDFVPISQKEISLWSSLTAYESQPYLDIDSITSILWKLWSARMKSLLTAFY
jgi:DNA polymerase III delta prime subunit